MDKKRRFSLSFKIYFLIIFLIFSCSCLTIIAGYVEHARSTDQYYQDLTGNLALTVSKTLNGSSVELLLNAAHDSEYQKIRKEAVKRQDESLIKDYLAARHLLLTYDNISSVLSKFIEYMDVTYIYLESFEDGKFFRIIDPDDGYYAFGYIGNLDAPFLPYSNQTQAISATYSDSEDGALCTSYEPIYNDDGKAVALVGVDVSVEELQSNHVHFALISILNALIISLIAAAAGVFFMRRNVTKPIARLCEETRKFSSKKGRYTNDDVTSLRLHSHDEIEDLYNEIRFLEKKIVSYLDHLVKVTGEKERTRTELSIAAQIQTDILPNQFPAFPERAQDFDLYAFMHPAKEVGGDFYDFFLIDDDHLALAIADVSGKGIPAAMFMAIVKSLLKNIVATDDSISPAGAISLLNDRICASNQSGMFVSVWLGILQISTGVLTACNAGHEYPVLCHKGQAFELVKDKHCLVMAAEEGVPYTDYQLSLQPGDCLFVYTDGVVEATNMDTELFGIDRMLEALNKDPKASPAELIENVKSSIDEFVGSAAQFDDITMLSVIYKP